MASKRKILFVDDDKSILSGLKRALRPERQQWEMVFESSGHAALERMKQEHFDAVVTDMRMPGVSGVELLSEVSQLYPDMIRFILSGYSDEMMALESTKTAHQFFTKPCDIELLKNALIRAFSLREVLADDRLKSLVSGIVSLPSLPAVYVKIVEQLQSPEVSVSAIGATIAKDPAVTAKVLQLVNSAFFGLGNRVASPEQAATLLGLDTLKYLVLSAGIFLQYENKTNNIKGFSLEQLINHSLGVGVVAKSIAQMEQASNVTLEECYLSGFLHDIGKLILAENLPDYYAKVFEHVNQGDEELYQVEQEILGTHHGAIGAYLLGLWGFSDAVMESAAFHHQPELSEGEDFAPLTAVHVANILIGNHPDPIESHISSNYLESIGMGHRLSEWRALLNTDPGE